MENESLLQRGVDFSLLPDNVHAFIKNGGELTPENDKSCRKLAKNIVFEQKENYADLQLLLFTAEVVEKTSALKPISNFVRRHF